MLHKYLLKMILLKDNDWRIQLTVVARVQKKIMTVTYLRNHLLPL